MFISVTNVGIYESVLNIFIHKTENFLPIKGWISPFDISPPTWMGFGFEHKIYLLDHQSIISRSRMYALDHFKFLSLFYFKKTQRNVVPKIVSECNKLCGRLMNIASMQ